MNPVLAFSIFAFALMLFQRTSSVSPASNVSAIKSILNDPGLQNAMFQHPVADGPTLYALLDTSTFEQLMDLEQRAKNYGRTDVAIAVLALAREKTDKEIAAIRQRLGMPQ